MRYLVVQKYYDKGQPSAYIKEVRADYEPVDPKEMKGYDYYEDVFDTIEEAEQFKEDTLNA